MSEFQIIRDCFTQIGSQQNVVHGVGDDAAVVQVPADGELVFATDTFIENVHFPLDTSPENIAYKALAVNLSDMAAMGARPLWFLLSLTCSQVSRDWLIPFSNSLAQLANAYNMQLIGGDTTSGPLSITIHMIGVVPTGKAVLRSGAKAGDLIFITGSIGDAGLGLRYKQGQTHSAEEEATQDFVAPSLLPKKRIEYLIERLERPEPRLKQGMDLVGVASAMIDISDGLFADLSHVLCASNKGAAVFLEKIPLSATNEIEHILAAANAGDDYELCFTIPAEKKIVLEQLSKKWDCPITQIGKIEQHPGLRCFMHDIPVDITVKGYDHFQSYT